MLDLTLQPPRFATILVEGRICRLGVKKLILPATIFRGLAGVVACSQLGSVGCLSMRLQARAMIWWPYLPPIELASFLDSNASGELYGSGKDRVLMRASRALHPPGF